MNVIITTLLAAILFIPSSLQAAFECFLHLDGVPGEATARLFEDQIVVNALSFGLSQPASTQSGGGGGSNQVAFSALKITKLLDKASPLLMLKCAQGAPISSAVITCRSSGPEPVTFYKITMTQVLVTGVTLSGETEAVRPSETVSLSFETINWEYMPQLPTGGSGQPIETGWDVKGNVQL